MSTIVWFRRDLRLTDNPALSYAAERGPVLPVYIHAPDEEAPWQPGAASNWWLHHSLNALKVSLEKLGLSLLVTQGPSATTLQTLAAESGAEAVVWNRLYEPACIRRDTAVKSTLRAAGIEAQSFNAALLNEPWQIQNKQGKAFKVFTPYWKTCKTRLEQSPPTLQSQPPLEGITAPLSGLSVDDLGLLPTLSWADNFSDHWQPGEEGAKTRLAKHLSTNLSLYKTDRDFPAIDATSKLSPHLHFGEIGPRQIWAALQYLAPTTNEGKQESRQRFLAELGWREYAHHLLYHFPETTEKPFNPKWQNFSWDNRDNSDCLSAWQKGETGISLVDAGMQELWQSGFMHNRVRMLVGSLLTKNMGIHWQQGARWFWDTLVDADLASNTLGWQWIAGCGADAAPYFRIFNPDTQADKFDGDASYRNSYLPIGWKQRAPVIDLADSRREALERYSLIKNQA